MNSLEVGSFITGTGAGYYGITDHRRVCRIIARGNGNCITVEVTGLLAGHEGIRSYIGTTHNIRDTNFTRYCPDTHGTLIEGAADLGIPGTYSNACNNLSVAIVTDKKLKSFGKDCIVHEVYETDMLQIRRKDQPTRPIIISKSKVLLLDGQAPVVGDFVTRSWVPNVTPACCTGATLLQVLSVGSIVALCKVVGGESVGDRDKVMIKLAQLERLDTTNGRQLADLGGFRVVQEMVNNLRAPVEEEEEVVVEDNPVQEKFWMIACSIEGGAYPATSTDGGYAPRRKIFIKTLALEILADMNRRHGDVFFLLEAVQAINVNGEVADTVARDVPERTDSTITLAA